MTKKANVFKINQALKKVEMCDSYFVQTLVVLFLLFQAFILYLWFEFVSLDIPNVGADGRCKSPSKSLAKRSQYYRPPIET